MTEEIDIKFDYKKIKLALRQANSEKQLFEVVVNKPFEDKLSVTMIDLGTIVFLTVDEDNRTINRVAISKTDSALQSQIVSEVPFKKIVIPLDDNINVISSALRENRHQYVTDWAKMFHPALSASSAHVNQRAAGIDCSYIYSLEYGNRRGAFIFSYYQPLSQTRKQREYFMTHYCATVCEELSKFYAKQSS